jgi:hypothetical protein
LSSAVQHNIDVIYDFDTMKRIIATTNTLARQCTGLGMQTGGVSDPYFSTASTSQQQFSVTTTTAPGVTLPSLSEMGTDTLARSDDLRAFFAKYVVYPNAPAATGAGIVWARVLNGGTYLNVGTLGERLPDPISDSHTSDIWILRAILGVLAARPAIQSIDLIGLICNLPSVKILFQFDRASLTGISDADDADALESILQSHRSESEVLADAAAVVGEGVGFQLSC